MAKLSRGKLTPPTPEYRLGFFNTVTCIGFPGVTFLLYELMLLHFIDNINEKKNAFFIKQLYVILFCPPTEGEGNILFLVQIPLALAWQFLVCMISSSWASWQSLTKFGRIEHWDIMKSLLGFCDLDLIFKVTAGLILLNISQKVLVWPKSACVQDIS